MAKIVYVVHNIDTEGPLNESIDATFKRIKDIFGVSLKKSKNNLKKLQNKEIDLSGKENAIANLVSEKRLNFLKTWKELEKNISEITSYEFRSKFPDSFNDEWIYNWF